MNITDVCAFNHKHGQYVLGRIQDPGKNLKKNIENYCLSWIEFKHF